MELEVLNSQGQPSGKTVNLPDEVFNIEPNDHAIYLSVKHYMANQRQGTHKAKERNEIAGSTKKIKRQKGTGTARFGDIKNPIFRGGGRIFGPRPRTYSSKLNKKVQRLARKSALAYKAKENSITVIEDLKMEQPATREYASLLKNLGLGDTRSLLVLADNDRNLFLSGRNIPTAEIVTAERLNTYEILKAGKLLLQESTVEKLIKQLDK